MSRFEVRKINPPRIHNPPNWAGGLPYPLITHCVWDSKYNVEYTTFTNIKAAQDHCDYYNRGEDEK